MFETFKTILDIVLHVDLYLAEMIATCGNWTYGILFLIIFAETGLVVTPFLPGDSLLFAAGAFCARAETGINVHLMALILFLAAVAGDTLNYWIGSRIGPAVFNREDSIWLRRRHLDRARAFFEKYGGRAIILARFAPIVRTFVPFVAGVGQMTYSRFISFNIIGGFAWIYLITYTGYGFGNHPFIQRNFKLVIVAIIVLSICPIAFELWRARRQRPAASVG